MDESDVARAVGAAMSLSSALGLAADDAVVLNNSNKLALRLLPCDVMARMAHLGHEVAPFEIDLAQRLAGAACPVAALDPRAEARVYEADGFVVTLWTYYESVPGEVEPAAFAGALEALHGGMRTLDIATPHFTDRVAEALELVASSDRTPVLADTDRALLVEVLESRSGSIRARNAPEQLLHGEPHPGNLLYTNDGLRFIDLETCCRGPVEFDLAHVPHEVAQRYRSLDQELLSDCRALVLAMVAAWRWDPDDQFPDGQRAGHAFLGALRKGPPWPTIDAVMREADDPSRSGARARDGGSCVEGRRATR